MKQDYTVQELCQTIETLKNFFDRVELAEPLSGKRLDPATLQPLAQQPTETAKPFDLRLELQAFVQKRSGFELKVQQDTCFSCQYHYCRVQGRALLLILLLDVTHSLCPGKDGRAALSREVESVHHTAVRDCVTDTFNETYLQALCEQNLPLLSARGNRVWLALFEVDDLDGLVRDYGPACRDMVLGHVAGALRQRLNLQERDGVVARSGDRLVFVCQSAAETLFAERVANFCAKERHCVTNLYKRVSFTVSAGSACWTEAPGWEPMMALLEQRLAQSRQPAQSSQDPAVG